MKRVLHADPYRAAIPRAALRIVDGARASALFIDAAGDAPPLAAREKVDEAEFACDHSVIGILHNIVACEQYQIVPSAGIACCANACRHAALEAVEGPPNVLGLILCRALSLLADNTPPPPNASNSFLVAAGSHQYESIHSQIARPCWSSLRAV